MTEKEAVAYLLLTTRTLRNYRQSGKLPYREVPGKTRPVIDYDRADLDRLKEQLEARQQKSLKLKTIKPALPRVTFGLSPAEYEELVQAASKVGMTAGEYMRRMAREGLESHFQREAEALRRELAQTNEEMRKMRGEFASAFEVLLVKTGVSPTDAKTWVATNLR